MMSVNGVVNGTHNQHINGYSPDDIETDEDAIERK
jgi:hypothetical protein